MRFLCNQEISVPMKRNDRSHEEKLSFPLRETVVPMKGNRRSHERKLTHHHREQTSIDTNQIFFCLFLFDYKRISVYLQ